MANALQKICLPAGPLRVVLLVGLLVSTAPHSLATDGHSSTHPASVRLSLHLTKTIARPRSEITAIVVSPDDRLLITVTSEKKTELWETQTGRLVAAVEGRVLHPFPNLDSNSLVAFSPDSKTLLTTNDKEANVWNTSTGELYVLKGHTKDIRSQSFTHDGKTILTGAADGTVKVWDAESGKLKFTLDAFRVKKYPRWRVLSRRIASLLAEIYVHPSPDNRMILTVPYGQPTKLWDMATGQMMFVFGEKNSYGTFSPRGSYVLTTQSHFTAMELWETATGKLKATFPPGFAVFSSNEEWLGLVEHNGRKGLLNLKTMTVEKPLPLSHNDFLSWASFSPNDQIFVQASGLHDHKAVLVDVPTSKTIAEIPVVSKRGFDLISDFIKYAEMLSFHPDSRILMGGNQERVRFWDSTTGKELASLTQVREPAVFSNNGKFVVTTDKDKKSLSFWELTIQQ